MESTNFNELAVELKTIKDWQRYAVTEMNQADVYFGHGAADAWQEANLLLASVTALSFPELIEVADCRLTSFEKQAFWQLLQKRIEQRIPASYLTQQAWFAGLPFFVDERVLVPRSPISELIEQHFEPWLTQPPLRILDLCTGSGCIAIACAYAFPEAEIDALDISEDALVVADINIQEHGLQHQVTPIQSDGFNAVKGERYDLIVTNPPYVDADDMADLPAEFRHEPELGLAAGNDGLDLVRRILREAPEQLTEQGILVCEVGNSLVHMQEIWPEVPFIWVEFVRGGEGVFVINREQLLQHAAAFSK
ncbi:50S ribosomal protein L3 N(5)-glutamine methyltransferase [Aliidiomarina minuta]|uniref:Ribosomal protein uL3 glutamine methyltransferase n=1 Tax=Aliidiomarina minuta TaxID=880057 RepID=A0A432W5U6_9GAMM|nr:50S ribosomal protein L3 N(5)-glutamine methyltransferase [Aliidiomarina minuta]RUO25356.1 50S ribosomal protein L3 N(5)-glutamine methyltransferase [Aliidiomarina minuta]